MVEIRQERIEKRSKSSEILGIFNKIWARSREILLDLAQIFLKISQNSLDQQHLAGKTDGPVDSGFSDLRGGDPTSDPPISVFGERNPMPTAKAGGLVGRGSSSVDSKGWVGSGGSLDGPTQWIVLHSNDKIK